MPCYYPMQASFSIREDGKKDIRFSSARAKLFHDSNLTTSKINKILGCEGLSLPCGNCMGCRIERARQWAVRCMHESQMHGENCFITLTYDNGNLPKGGTLVKKHIQKFNAKLRRKFSDKKLKFFYCGEYGDKLERPHYHVLVFGLDLLDKQLFKVMHGSSYYTSDILSSCWSFGFSLVTDLTFDSANYVARYCTKKINGKMAEEHYKGRLPEFAHMSTKPAIGREWLDKFFSDVFPEDVVVVNGYRCKVPRYYDKVLEKMDPILYGVIKEARQVSGEFREDDNTHRRLLVREQCQEAKMRFLKRTLEQGGYYEG